jgi:single-strand selective monofunctional uracil DNA glycosylase
LISSAGCWDAGRNALPHRRDALAERAVGLTRRCRAATASLRFAAPVTYVYRPLEYAWRPHAEYLRRFGAGRRRVLLLGMNPGPWGMAQTGIPFGEVNAVRDWLGIAEPVGRPPVEHPKRPVTGFACPRSEVSGRRLWGLFAARFGAPAAFFADHLVLNYCPLVFMEESGRNRTPDRLPAAESAPLFAACDTMLADMIELYVPEWVVGIGGFAERRLRELCKLGVSGRAQIGRLLHPSPASPAANRNWAATATRQLEEQGIW